jgi:hypothetical protein
MSVQVIADSDHKVPTIREINARARAFWKEQNELMKRRLGDPVLLQLVKDELASYKTWPVPFPYQKSFEAMLENAERAKQRVLAYQGQKGGQAKKPDALQELIISLLRRRPSMTVSRLLEALEREPRGSTIIDIAEELISFTQPDGTPEGRMKQAALSGLKDRLSRARKKLNSR